MKKLSAIIALILFAGVRSLSADSLDDLIIYSLNNSTNGMIIEASRDSDRLTRQSAYLALIPSFKLDAGYAASSTTNKFSAGIAFSFPLSDIDGIIQTLRMSENTYLSGVLQAEIDTRTYIESIIDDYAQLAVYEKEREISLAEISNSLDLLNIMNIKLKSSDEIAVNIRKLSNEIEISKQELILSEISYSNELKSLENECGMVPDQFELTLDEVSQSTNIITQYELLLSQYQLEISNYIIENNLYRRQIFLPELSFGLSYDNDFISGSSSYNFSLGLDIDVLDYFDKRNEIKQNEIDIMELQQDISDTFFEFQSALTLMENKIVLLQEEIVLLEDQVDIERELQQLYEYQYKTDALDYYEYKVLLNDLLNAEYDLLESKSDLFILMKKLQYGILDDS